MSDEPYRAIGIKHVEIGIDKILELGKVTQVKVSQKSFFMLEKMPDGKWRLTYTPDIIDDISKLEALVVIRNEGN